MSDLTPVDLGVRQHALLAPELRETPAVVIGAGMTGSWTALALARLCARVELWDGDRVARENLGTQAYTEEHLGVLKARAIASIAYPLPVVPFATQFARWNRCGPDSIVVSCVDSRASRAGIAAALRRQQFRLFIDTRVAGEVAILYTVTDIADYKLPPRGVHAPPCGAVGTAYVGLWVAARVAATINNVLRGIPVPRMQAWHVGLNQDITEREE